MPSKTTLADAVMVLLDAHMAAVVDARLSRHSCGPDVAQLRAAPASTRAALRDALSDLLK